VEINRALFERAAAAFDPSDAEHCRRAVARHTGELIPDERYEE
jgi:hypothetical protein